MLDLRHLHTLTTLRDYGSLALAAQQLHVTQSALSHQIKALEEHYGCTLFVRKSRPLRWTPAGQRLLELAEQVLTQMHTAERDIAQLVSGQGGRLHIALECHSCFEWLMPSMDAFRARRPEVKMDLSAGFNFDALPALLKGDVDLVITSDATETPGVIYKPLFRYQAMLVTATDHPLTQRQWIEPRDLAAETLITYPVPRSRLDIFRYFLHPAGVEPRAQRTAELTLMIMQLVASGRGVAALPNWAVADYLAYNYVAARPLGRDGMWGTLYAALRAEHVHSATLRDFISLARATSFRTLTGIRRVT
ncbi:MAG: LysR substrate-binding domain-containing protein [Pseudomonadota bacterium]